MGVVHAITRVAIFTCSIVSRQFVNTACPLCSFRKPFNGKYRTFSDRIYTYTSKESFSWRINFHTKSSTFESIKENIPTMHPKEILNQTYEKARMEPRSIFIRYISPGLSNKVSNAYNLLGPLHSSSPCIVWTKLHLQKFLSYPANLCAYFISNCSAFGGHKGDLNVLYKH